MPTTPTLRAVGAALVATLFSAVGDGCGARTGLLVPDVETSTDATADVDVPDVPDVVDRPIACVPGHFTLEARAADLLLVIDRSGSMDQGLSGTRGGTSKWSLMRSALATTLPRFQDRIHVGALFYPEDGAASRLAACAFSNVPIVDVAPAAGAVPTVLDVFNNTSPGGSTPTAAALLRAYTWLVRNANPARARYLVLATDGGPNCNTALNPTTCTCVNGNVGGCGGGPGGSPGSINCLDDVRTVSTIAQIASNPVTSIPTFVIGIAGDNNPAVVRTLNQMAVAGGRPNRTAAGQPTYFNAQQEGDLERAFNAIQGTIARCTYIAATRPADTDVVTLAVNGMRVSRDTSRVNGWDWTDRAIGEITLFGAACPTSTVPLVDATVECNPDAR